MRTNRDKILLFFIPITVPLVFGLLWLNCHQNASLIWARTFFEDKVSIITTIFIGSITCLSFVFNNVSRKEESFMKVILMKNGIKGYLNILFMSYLGTLFIIFFLMPNLTIHNKWCLLICLTLLLSLWLWLLLWLAIILSTLGEHDSKKYLVTAFERIRFFNEESDMNKRKCTFWISVRFETIKSEHVNIWLEFAKNELQRIGQEQKPLDKKNLKNLIEEFSISSVEIVHYKHLELMLSIVGYLLMIREFRGLHDLTKSRLFVLIYDKYGSFYMGSSFSRALRELCEQVYEGPDVITKLLRYRENNDFLIPLLGVENKGQIAEIDVSGAEVNDNYYYCDIIIALLEFINYQERNSLIAEYDNRLVYFFRGPHISPPKPEAFRLILYMTSNCEMSIEKIPWISVELFFKVTGRKSYEFIEEFLFEGGRQIFGGKSYSVMRGNNEIRYYRAMAKQTKYLENDWTKEPDIERALAMIQSFERIALDVDNSEALNRIKSFIYGNLNRQSALTLRDSFNVSSTVAGLNAVLKNEGIKLGNRKSSSFKFEPITFDSKRNKQQVQDHPAIILEDFRTSIYKKLVSGLIKGLHIDTCESSERLSFKQCFNDLLGRNENLLVIFNKDVYEKDSGVIPFLDKFEVNSLYRRTINEVEYESCNIYALISQDLEYGSCYCIELGNIEGLHINDNQSEFSIIADSYQSDLITKDNIQNEVTIQLKLYSNMQELFVLKSGKIYQY